MRGPEACSCGAGDVVIGEHQPTCAIFKEPERCACGHPFVDHTDIVGCTGDHASRYWFCACPGYAEAPSPLSEDGAVSAIADHSGPAKRATIPAADAGGGTYSTEPRRTLHGPTVEAAGDAHPSYRKGLQTHEHRLVRELAAALLDLRVNPIAEGLSRRFLDAAYAVAALVPVLHCAGCDRDFLQMDGRNTMWCSERCRSRVGQRARRSRLKAEAAGKPARCDPSRGIHVRPHTAETGCVPRPVSPITASTDDAK